MEDVDKTLRRLKTQKIFVQALYMLCPFGFLVVGFLAYRGVPTKPLALLGAASTLFLLFVIFYVHRKYLNDAMLAHIRCGVCSGLSEVRAQSGSNLAMCETEALHMMPTDGPKGEKPYFHYGFEGVRDGRRVRGAEVAFGYRSLQASMGYIYTVGSLFIENDMQSANGEWLVLRNDFLEPNARERFLAEKHYDAFAPTRSFDSLKNFSFYGKGAQPLASEVEKRIAALAAVEPQVGAIKLQSDRAAVFISERFYSGEIRLTSRITKNWLVSSQLPGRGAMEKLFDLWAGALECTDAAEAVRRGES